MNQSAEPPFNWSNLGQSVLFCTENRPIPSALIETIISAYGFNPDVNLTNHPDVHLLQPESNLYRVETIRQLLELAYSRPQMGHYRIIALTSAERLSEIDQNTLLKVLEEPPQLTVLLLFTTNLDPILPTVRSRCVIFRLDQVIDSVLNTHTPTPPSPPAPIAKFLALPLPQPSLYEITSAVETYLKQIDPPDNLTLLESDLEQLAAVFAHRLPENPSAAEKLQQIQLAKELIRSNVPKNLIFENLLVKIT
jgi:hypothetical protein